jgi:hypothetical protein
VNVSDRAETMGETHDVRVTGAVVAAGIALAIAVAGISALPGLGWVFGIAGLPGTTWLAWRMAPRAVRGGNRDAARVSLELAVLSILIADVLVVAVPLGAQALGAVGSIPPSVDQGAVIGAIVQAAVAFVPLTLIGAFLFGLPAAIVVLPAAFAWTAIVRRVAGVRP